MGSRKSVLTHCEFNSFAFMDTRWRKVAQKFVRARTSRHLHLHSDWCNVMLHKHKTITAAFQEHPPSIQNATLMKTRAPDRISTFGLCKLWLYQHFVVTKLCWFFTALDLSQTFVKSLQSKATKFLKSWSGLPRSANTTILFLGKSGRTGLHVTNLVTYCKQMQLVRMDILKRSADPRCNRVYDALLKRQTSWLRTEYPPAVEHACATTVVDSNRRFTRRADFRRPRARPR